MQDTRLSDELEESSKASPKFHLLVAFSCLIATLGLIADSPAVVIGAMLVAPLLTPIQGLALGSVRGRQQLLASAALGLCEGVATAVLFSAVISWVAIALPIDALTELTHEAEARTRPNPFDLCIALAGGAVGAYAIVRMPNSDALPGVAIATALMPPLCTVGIGIAMGDRGTAGGAALLFLTNLSAIIFAGIVVFFFLGFRPESWRVGALPTFLTSSLLLVIGVTLVTLTTRAVDEAHASERLRSAVVNAIEAQRPGSELLDIRQDEVEGVLRLRVTVRTDANITNDEIAGIQAVVSQRLQRPVSLVFVVVPMLILEAQTPLPKGPAPTPIPTPVQSPTPSGRIYILPNQVFVPFVAADE